MPLKKEANDLLKNRFFLLAKEQFEKEYFERWLNSECLEDREDVNRECKAFREIIARIELEAGSYESPTEWGEIA